MSTFEWPLKTGFTVSWLRMIMEIYLSAEVSGSGVKEDDDGAGTSVSLLLLTELAVTVAVGLGVLCSWNSSGSSGQPKASLVLVKTLIESTIVTPLGSVLVPTRIIKQFLTLYRPDTPKQVLLQTVKTQMKCCIMQHFIRVCTICNDKINLQRKKYNFF